MKTYTVTLPDEFAAMVDRWLAAGMWESVDYLFMSALLHADEAIRFEDSLDQEWVKREVQKGIESQLRGESAPLDMNEIWARVQKQVTAEKESARALRNADG